MPPCGRKSIVCSTRCRRLETDVLIVNRDSLTLRPGAVWIDVDEVMRATVMQPTSLALLDGDLLEDLDGIDPSFDAWLMTERERLRDRARGIAEAMLRENLEPDAAISAAQRLLTIDRSHEGAWRAMMRALCRARRAWVGGAGLRPLPQPYWPICWMRLPRSETQKLLNEIRGPSHTRLPPRPPQPVEASPSTTSNRD